MNRFLHILLLPLLLAFSAGGQTYTNTKLPYTRADIYADNSIPGDLPKMFDGLWDAGDPSTKGVNVYSFIHSPLELRIKLGKYNAKVRKVQFRTGYSNKGPVSIILVKKSDGSEVNIGTYTSPTYFGIDVFTPADQTFETDYIILRTTSTGEILGQEFEIFADWTVPTVTHAPTTHKPFRNMFGVNTYWHDLIDGGPMAHDTAKRVGYDSLLTMGVSSMRLYTEVKHYMADTAYRYTFDPGRDGYREDALLRRWTRDAGHLGPMWGTAQLRFPWLQDSWQAAGKSRDGRLNLHHSNNNPTARMEDSTWLPLAKAAYTFATRRGATTTGLDYFVKEKQYGYANYQDQAFKGLNYKTVWEGGNEVDADWEGYDGNLKAEEIAMMQSMMFDGHKGRYSGAGARQADPNYLVSTSGLAHHSVDRVKDIWKWWKTNRGVIGGKVDVATNVLQLHSYSYVGGAYQYNATGVLAGLPPEEAMIEELREVVDFVRTENPEVEIWIGEWGIDTHPNSEMNAPAYGAYTAEQTQANWAIRTMLEMSGAGIDRAQWFRVYVNNDRLTDATKFESMSLLRKDTLAPDANNNVVYSGTISYRPVGNYWRQAKHFGDYVFDKYLDTSGAKRVLRFKNGTKYLIGVWAKEVITYPAGQRPTFTERTGTYNLSVDNGLAYKKIDLNYSGAALTIANNTSTGTVAVPYGSKPTFIEVTTAGAAPGGAGFGPGTIQSVNTSPTASAGGDQTITLPTSQVTLTGSGSDAEGSVTYAWTKISGPSGGTITSPSSASTTVTALTQGVYVYRLTVTDAGGLTAQDDVQVTVNAAPAGTRYYKSKITLKREIILD